GDGQQGKRLLEVLHGEAPWGEPPQYVAPRRRSVRWRTQPRRARTKPSRERASFAATSTRPAIIMKREAVPKPRPRPTDERTPCEARRRRRRQSAERITSSSLRSASVRGCALIGAPRGRRG